MATHLGTFLKARRQEQGWSLGEVARLLGYRNVSKGARRVHLMEQGERHSHAMLTRLVPLLGIEARQAEELLFQDSQESVAAWVRWADEAVPIQIVVRCIPGIFGKHPVPPDLKTPDEVVAYAQTLARRVAKKVFVVLSRRVTVSINDAGEIAGRHEATPNDDPRPYMRLGMKRFLMSISPTGEAPQ